MNIFNKSERMPITKKVYHENKNKFKKGEEIVAIAKKVGSGYAGYSYYMTIEAYDKLNSK